MRAAIIDRWEYLETQERERIKQLIEFQQKELTDKDTLILTKEKHVNYLERQVIKYKSNPRKEKTYQAWLHGLIGGGREVRAGKSIYKDKRKQKRIDNVTENLIFECKKAKNWQQAITQILYYKDLLIKDKIYNNQVACVFLFDDVNETESEIPLFIMIQEYIHFLNKTIYEYQKRFIY